MGHAQVTVLLGSEKGGQQSPRGGGPDMQKPGPPLAKSYKALDQPDVGSDVQWRTGERRVGGGRFAFLRPYREHMFSRDTSPVVLL